MNDHFDPPQGSPGFESPNVGPPPLATPPTSKKAVASLVLGILAPLTCALTSIPGVVCGVLAMVDANKSAGRLRGQGMAIAGLILSSVAILFVPISAALLLPAIVNARRMGEEMRSRVNMHQISLALTSYAFAKGQFPPAAIRSEDGEPLHSWRTALLPYLDRQSLFEAIDFDVAWDDAKNEQATSVPVETYQRSEDFGLIEARTNYFAVVGEGFVFDGGSRTSPDGVKDGASTTILFVEYAPSTTRWAAPEDLSFEGYAEYVLGAGAPPSHRGFRAAMVDGSVRTLPADITREELHALFTIRGRELTEEATLSRGEK